jgi:DNA-binding Lrp family transcriptional regulator
MTDPLAILFGNQARVKLLRFFLFNPTQEFTFDDISKRAKLVRRTARTEINALERAEVIKKIVMHVKHPTKDTKIKVQGFALNDKFPQLASLQTFLFETAPINGATVMKHMRKVGPVDFIVCTGVFTRDFDRRLDLMIAMKKLNEGKIEVAMRALEAELGIEIRYATFNSEDLKYRVGMNDKLTRDVFDYPYIILVDKLGVRNELFKP